MLWLVSAYRALAISIFLRFAGSWSSGGRPPCLPLALADCKPALVRSRIMSRSKLSQCSKEVKDELATGCGGVHVFGQALEACTFGMDTVDQGYKFLE